LKKIIFRAVLENKRKSEWWLLTFLRVFTVEDSEMESLIKC
jgi:hypothetical protein